MRGIRRIIIAVRSWFRWLIGAGGLVSDDSTFIDLEGRSWKITITAREAMRLSREYGIFVSDIRATNWACCDEWQVREDYPKGLDNICNLVPILYTVLEDQIDRRKLSPDDFAACLQGDTLWDARCALTHALSLFFSDRQALILQKQLALGEKIGQGAMKLQEAVLSKMTEKEIEQEFSRVANFFTTSEQPSESTSAVTSGGN